MDNHWLMVRERERERERSDVHVHVHMRLHTVVLTERERGLEDKYICV